MTPALRRRLAWGAAASYRPAGHFSRCFALGKLLGPMASRSPQASQHLSHGGARRVRLCFWRPRHTGRQGKPESSHRDVNQNRPTDRKRSCIVP